MSLIHDAIKEIEYSAGQAEASAVSGRATAAAPATRHRLQQKPLFMLLISALAASAIGYGLTRPAEPALPAPDAPIATAAVAAPTQPLEAAVATLTQQTQAAQVTEVIAAPAQTETTALPQEAATAAARQPVSSAYPEKASAPQTSIDAASASAPSTAIRADNPLRAEATRRHPANKASAAPKSAISSAAAPTPTPVGPADTSDSLTVEQHYAQLTQALGNDELERAQAHLTALESLLPAASIALLRARAWYFSKRQDTASARAIFRQILERLPGDENAGLNLAALEVQAGQPQRARSLLTAVLRQHPDSPAVQQAIARLTEGGQ